MLGLCDERKLLCWERRELRPQVRPPALSKQTNKHSFCSQAVPGLVGETTASWVVLPEGWEVNLRRLLPLRTLTAPDPGSPVSELLQVVLTLLPGDHMLGSCDMNLQIPPDRLASEPPAVGSEAYAATPHGRHYQQNHLCSPFVLRDEITGLCRHAPFREYCGQATMT